MKKQKQKKSVVQGGIRCKLVCAAAAWSLVVAVAAGAGAVSLFEAPQQWAVGPVVVQPQQEHTVEEQKKEPVVELPEQDIVQPEQPVPEETAQLPQQQPASAPLQQGPEQETVQQPEMEQTTEMLFPELPQMGAQLEEDNSAVIFLQETPELAAQDPMADPANVWQRHAELAQQLPEDSMLLTPEQLLDAMDGVAEQCLPLEEENCLSWIFDWLFGKTEEPVYSGWRTEDGKTYYYTQDTHKKLTGIQSVDDKLYYFDKDGVLQQGVTFGIDVSKYQTNMDWQQIKKAGVSFVLIRIGYRGYGAEGKLVLDPMFEEHFTNARNAGLKVGVYFFSQAVNEDEAREEAFGCAYVLNGRALDLPIYFDTEASTSPTGTGRADALGVTERTNCAIAFCEEVKANGYRPGVYASTTWFGSRVEYERLTCYSIWNAHYGVPSSPVSCDLWQGSCTVKISGYDGLLDANISYMSE